jgi:hypothetical protein
VLNKKKIKEMNKVCEIESEPIHSTCCRIISAPISIALCAPLAWLVTTELASAPVLFVGMIALKCGVCSNCCPEVVYFTFRNIILTPCRLARIAYLGKGHVVCWKHPAWPFRHNSSLADLSV